MRSIFELTDPRDEVLTGELSEDIFAARLKDVIDGAADPVYLDPTRFFANTYPTDGLRSLLREVLGRLTGYRPANNPIVRLETSFGGGKTHNLIALYHVVGGKTQRTDLSAYLEADWPGLQPGEVDVVGVVGSDLDPANGVYHEADDIRT